MPSRTFLCLCLCFLLFVLSSSAQNSVLDSLRNELKTHPKKDTIRVKLLINTAWNMTYDTPNEAFPYVAEALDISNQLDWKKGVGFALRQEGTLYYSMANYVKAMESYLKALKISQTLDPVFIASLHNNLGNIYAELKQYDKAISSYEEYLKLSKKATSTINEINGLTNLGLIYTETDQIDKGIQYIEEALALAKAENVDFYISSIINNLGLAYKRKKDYPKSLEYYNEARVLAHDQENAHVEAATLNNIADINMLLKEYDAAESNSLEALKLAEASKALDWESDSWEALSIIYKEKGAYEKALNAYQKHIVLRDSVINEEKRAELTRKEMQFQLERQQTIADDELKRQQLIKKGLLIGGIFILLAAIIGYFLYKKRRDAIEQKNSADFKSKVSETELKALRSQMNPHFIFNALNSISNYMETHDIDTANEYLAMFSKLMRSILENSEKKWIPLAEELELMELYMQLESLRLKHKLTYSIHIDPSIDSEDTLVPPLITQPFIENSIWHGISKKESEGTITINVHKNTDSLVISIEDDGVGRAESEKNSTKNSMGIKITKTRLDIINSLQKLQSNFKISDKEQGVKVELTLPLEVRF